MSRTKQKPRRYAVRISDYRSGVACLERLCEELVHPDEARRSGARAAVSWLNRFAMLDSPDRLEPAMLHPDVDSSVAHAVEELERSILEREQARRLLQASGDTDLEIVLN